MEKPAQSTPEWGEVELLIPLCIVQWLLNMKGPTLLGQTLSHLYCVQCERIQLLRTFWCSFTQDSYSIEGGMMLPSCESILDVLRVLATIRCQGNLLLAEEWQAYSTALNSTSTASRMAVAAQVRKYFLFDFSYMSFISSSHDNCDYQFAPVLSIFWLIRCLDAGKKLSFGCTCPQPLPKLKKMPLGLTNGQLQICHLKIRRMIKV